MEQFPNWISKDEIENSPEVNIRVNLLLAMGAKTDWPRRWYKKISTYVGIARQPLIIELLAVDDHEYDYPQYFVPMKEKAVHWLNSDNKKSPFTLEEWEKLRTYEKFRECQINSVLDMGEKLTNETN